MALFGKPESDKGISTPKLRCRKCKGEVPLNEFVMDPESKGLICTTCSKLKDKKVSISTTKQVATEAPKEQKAKPKDWDKEDEMIEQLSRRKQFDPKPRFQQIAGTNEGYMNCFACGYRFKYNLREMYPSTCPYCNAKVPQV